MRCPACLRPGAGRLVRAAAGGLLAAVLLPSLAAGATGASLDPGEADDRFGSALGRSNVGAAMVLYGGLLADGFETGASDLWSGTDP